MPDYHPVAQVFCRYIEKPLPRHFRSGSGFIDNRASQETDSTLKSLDISLFPNKTIRVGRDIDNDIAIVHPYVSRQHFVLYSIEYEEGKPPLVYVRDPDSLCGTYVANDSARPFRVPSSGYLLSQGEIIHVNPYWEFHVYLLGTQHTNSMMSRILSSEVDVFRDRFLVTRTLLGTGAHAGVHLAINLKTGRQVACKIHQLAHPTSTLRRILDETNILSRLTHPNLLKFEAAFRSPHNLYTFTELATGGDLFSMRLRYPSGLREIDTKIIIRQIVEAVCYLHDQDIAHRDLKPENIFFATGPGFMTRVIVGDLGFAKIAAPGRRLASKIGTQRFMAPEICCGHFYDKRVDIWSIGMVSLFLVAVSWDNLEVSELSDQHAVDDILATFFDDLSRQHRALSDNFEDFIRACLIVVPSKRMTANASRDHNWFRSSGPRLRTRIEEFTREWRPASIVHNSIEELELIAGAALSSFPTVSPNNTNADAGREPIRDAQTSHYFRSGGP
ncbi:kinase-like domain-containing protein [Nemania sp. FL0916]|nr:kinase-like domain-containing protein [Nemania sp. FL0916]